MMLGTVRTGLNPSGLARAGSEYYKCLCVLATVQTRVSSVDVSDKIRLDPVTSVSARWDSAIRNRATAAGDQSCVAARPRAIPSDF